MSSSAFAGPLSDLTLFESNAPGTPLCLRIANGFAARLAADLRVHASSNSNLRTAIWCAPARHCCVGDAPMHSRSAHCSNS